MRPEARLELDEGGLPGNPAITGLRHDYTSKLNLTRQDGAGLAPAPAVGFLLGGLADFGRFSFRLAAGLSHHDGGMPPTTAPGG